MYGNQSAPVRAFRAPFGVRLAQAGAVALVSVTLATCHSDNPIEPTATQLVVTAQPSAATAGAAFTVTVEARDNSDRLATGFTEAVTLSTAAGPGTITSGAVVNAVGGIATFNSVVIQKAGTGYSLSASSSGLAGATTGGFDVSAASAAKLVFTVQASTATAGTPISPPVVVTAEDPYDNVAPTFTGAVTLTAASGPGQITAGGTATLANGVATFSALTLDKVGAYTLTATSGALSVISGSSIRVDAGPANKLAFIQQPSDAAADSAMKPAVTVTVQDASGNTASFSGSITLTFLAGTNTSGATLTGATASVANGVATFSNLKIDKAGTGYAVTASAAGVSPATSGPFNVSAGTATQLIFIVQPPSSANTGQTLVPAVRIQAQDGSGNVATNFNTQIQLALLGNPMGVTLTGGSAVTPVNGVATFGSLSINKVGTYTLAATAGNLSGESTPIAISSGPASQLVFTVQPTDANAKAPILGSGGAPVSVTARDANGNTATSFTSVPVTLTITPATNTTGATLSGGAGTAVDGVASFPTLSIDKPGSYTLTASSGALNTISSALTITAVTTTVAQLAFMVQPSEAAGGVAITPAVKVAAQDTSGNTVTDFQGSITVQIAANTGSAGAQLTGTTTVTAVSGVATFNTLKIDKAGANYQLQAKGSGLSVVSDPFTISSGPASQLIFTVQPTDTNANAPILGSGGAQVSVTARDANGNTATSFTSVPVTLTITAATNTTGATLSGGAGTAVDGVASFPTLSIDKPGTYTLTASSGALNTVSASFTITAVTTTVAQLAFTVQPSEAAGGVAITPAVKVAAQDANGNTVTGFQGSITVQIATNSGSAGAQLTGDTTVSAVSGVATFNTLKIDKAGANYQLQAKGANLSVVSDPFTILPSGVADHLAFLVQPKDTIAGKIIGRPLGVQVVPVDAGGNPVTDFTGDVTLMILSGTPGAVLSCGDCTYPLTRPADNSGVATFTQLSIDSSGTYVLQASSGLVPNPGSSASFTINADTVVYLDFTVQPRDTVAGDAINAPGGIEVRAKDVLGNTVPGFTDNVTLSLSAGKSGAHLLGTTQVKAVGGIAAFTNLMIDSASTNAAQYTLSATSPSAPQGATSAGFDVTAGPAVQIAFVAPVSNTIAQASIYPAVQVAGEDRFGNIDLHFADSVRVGLELAPPAGGTLNGHTAQKANQGIATFDDLSISQVGDGYELNAQSGTFLKIVSNSFAITPGTVAKLAFTTQPSDAIAGELWSVEVTAQDANGNTVTTFASTVTLQITVATNTTGATLSTTSSLAVAAVKGVATFGGLSIDVAKAAPGYTLDAIDGTLNNTQLKATSTSFAVTAAKATHLVFTTPPITTQAGAVMSTAVVVEARDDFENVDKTYAGSIALSIETPNGATLSGTTIIPTPTEGHATFPGLSIDYAGAGYHLLAKGSGLQDGRSGPFDITANRLVFTTQPTSTTKANTDMIVQVAAQDAFGHNDVTFTGPVTLALSGGDPAAILSGGSGPSVNNGVFTFTVQVDKIQTGYTLVGSTTVSGVTPTPTSNAFTVRADRLEFTIDPVETRANATIPTVVVKAVDGYGTPDPNSADQVTVTLGGTNPHRGSLTGGGATQVNGSSGASFSSLTIDRLGDYQLLADANGLLRGTSATFNVLADRLVFTNQPQTSPAGSDLTGGNGLEVWATDGFGLVDSYADPNFNSDVELAISTGTGTTGATLTSTTPATASAGKAKFDSPISIDFAGAGYQLQAHASGVTGVTDGSSDPFNITATRLVFAIQPIDSKANHDITVTVAAEDPAGNIDGTFTGPVTLALSGGTSGAILSPAGGGTPTSPQPGTFEFTVQVDRIGVNYVLTASNSVTSAQSNYFKIGADRLEFTTNPVDTKANASIPVVVVKAVDGYHDVDPDFTGDVTLSLKLKDQNTGHPNPNGGTLTGGGAIQANGSAGASFSSLVIDYVGDYQLLADATGFTQDTSATFNVLADRLVFTSGTPISAHRAEDNMAPSGLTVKAQDGASHTDQLFKSNVTLAITSLTGTAGATLTTSPASPVTAQNGVATFTSASINYVGQGYTLEATSGTLAKGVTDPFDVTANRLVFKSITPTSPTSNAPFDVRVEAQDAFNHTDVTFDQVLVTLQKGSTSPGAYTITPTTPQAQTNQGVVTFNSIQVSIAGLYSLSATGTGGTGTVSGESPTFSVQGQLITFYTYRDGNAEIYVMNPDGSNPIRLTNDASLDEYAALSPDGTKIAFLTFRDGNSEIYVMNADGSNPINLTNNAAGDGYPAWSPDGTKIAFETSRDGNSEIYVMNADGSNPINLTNNAANEYAPAWSPDGTKIAFETDRDANLEIYVMNADGNNPIRLTNNLAADVFPAWSPDGTKIAFQTNRDGNTEIYVMNADGSGPSNLTSNTAGDYLPAWSPDGTKIAFQTNRDGNSEIYVMNADGTGATNITLNPAFDGRPGWGVRRP